METKYELKRCKKCGTMKNIIIDKEICKRCNNQKDKVKKGNKPLSQLLPGSPKHSRIKENILRESSIHVDNQPNPSDLKNRIQIDPNSFNRGIDICINYFENNLKVAELRELKTLVKGIAFKKRVIKHFERLKLD